MRYRAGYFSLKMPRKKCRKILIIGPLGEVGGVKTHVELLAEILEPLASKIEISKSLRLRDFFYFCLMLRPQIVIFNLSIYRNQVIKNYLYRFLFSFWQPACVLHLHGGTFKDLALGKISHFLLKPYFLSFKKIFCLTNEQYDFISAFNNLEERIEKIHNYVKIPPEKVIEKDNEYLDLLYVGRLHPDKGIMESIEAVKQINNPKVRLWVIGSGELEDEVRHAQNQRVRYLGKLFGLEKENYFYKAHVFLLPSSWKEGLPYALLEGAASGQVLVATDVGAIDQVLEDGVNGFFVKPNNVSQLVDVINILFNDRLRLREMGKASRQIALQRFSLDNLLKIYIDFVQLYLSE